MALIKEEIQENQALSTAALLEDAFLQRPSGEQVPGMVDDVSPFRNMRSIQQETASPSTLTVVHHVG
jgi:hypothetical protein